MSVISDPALIGRMGIGEAWRNYVAAMDVVKAAIEARRPVSALHWRTIADVSLAAHLDKIDAWLTRENWSGAWSPK